MIRPIDFKTVGVSTFRAQPPTDADNRIDIASVSKAIAEEDERIAKASAKLEELNALTASDVCNPKSFKHMGGKTGHQLTFGEKTVKAVGDWLLQVIGKDNKEIWMLNACHCNSRTFDGLVIANKIRETCEHIHELYREARIKSAPIKGRLEALLEKCARR